MKGCLRSILTPGNANAFGLRQSIITVNFITGIRTCGVLASLFNGVLIVVPIDDGVYIWDELQHVHGDFERERNADGTERKFHGEVLATAMRVLRLD
jgi:hypothetical protein